MHLQNPKRCNLATPLIALLAMTAVACTGCQTLSSLGLPVIDTSKQLTPSAGQISHSHSRAVQIPRELQKQPMPVYVVEAGDSLLIETADLDSQIRLPNDQTVQPDGSINLGKYGIMRVSGLSVEQIRAQIQTLVESQESGSPLITVQLVDSNSKVYYVMGEVTSPGSFPYTGNETVLDALIAAGDISQKSDRHKIILSRPTTPCGERIVLPICYDQIIQLGDTSTNYQLLPGDRLFVPSIGLLDDVFNSLLPGRESNCPRCSGPQIGRRLPSLVCPTNACPSPTNARRHR